MEKSEVSSLSSPKSEAVRAIVEGDGVSQVSSAQTLGKDCTVCGVAEQDQFAIRCNVCSRWYHPWCLGYQLDLHRSCLVTSTDVDIPLHPSTGLPAVRQWFCDSCASTKTGVVAAGVTSKKR